MPRFFFHLYDDLVARDDEGAQMPTLQAAYEHAVWSARNLAATEVLAGKLHLDHRIEIEKRTALSWPPYSSAMP